MQIKCKYNIEYKEVRRGWSTQHLYCVSGKEYPSVSAILNLLDDGKSGGLMGWATKLAVNNLADAFKKGELNFENIDEAIKIARKRPQDTRDEACDIGTQCHNAIDGMIKGEKNYYNYLIDEKAKNSFNLFWDWFSQNNLTFISGDMPVVSVKYGFGGRLDAIAEDKKGNVILLDWKTSNHINKGYAYQVAGYSIALQESCGIKATRAFVVRFGKEDIIVEEREINLKYAKKAFLALVKLYYENKKELFKEVI